MAIHIIIKIILLVFSDSDPDDETLPIHERKNLNKDYFGFTFPNRENFVYDFTSPKHTSISLNKFSVMQSRNKFYF